MENTEKRKPGRPKIFAVGEKVQRTIYGERKLFEEFEQKCYDERSNFSEQLSILIKQYLNK